MTPEQKFEILKIEMGLIQSTLDKYDDLIFRGRNFFVTLWLACIGLAFTIQSGFVPLLAVGLSILYWFFEGMMRYQYWFKYVDRYRFLRRALNPGAGHFDVEKISVYDLTNHNHRKSISWLAQAKACFFKKEPFFVYALMACAAFLVWVLLNCHVIEFGAKK